MTTIPASNTYTFGLLVKSWATGLDYFTAAASSALPSTSPTTAVGNAIWALPPLGKVSVPLSSGTGSATISAVGMTWGAFASLLHSTNNVASLGQIANPFGATNVVIVQGDDSDTMVLRLPGSLRLQASEKAFLDGSSTYAIADFYDDLFTARGWTAPKVAAPVTAAADILKLSANRVGDYTMSSCDN
jgi:hypothetical protein